MLTVAEDVIERVILIAEGTFRSCEVFVVGCVAVDGFCQPLSNEMRCQTTRWDMDFFERGHTVAAYWMEILFHLESASGLLIWCASSLFFAYRELSCSALSLLTVCVSGTWRQVVVIEEVAVEL